MIASTIDILAALDPSALAPSMLSMATARIQQGDRPSALLRSSSDQFLSKYTKPNFGYYIALQFSNHACRFPIRLQGRDEWVYKACMMLRDPWQHFNKHVAEAYHIARQAHVLPELRHQLHALLLSFDTRKTHEDHLADVARRTGIAYPVIDAFEILFFNVLDRQRDGAYLANQIYPSTRLPEMDEDYLRNSSSADILRRVGYNHKDMDLTAYLAGLGDHTFLRKMAASNNREAELTRFIMGNGLLLTHTNLLNQKSIGMSRASTLLAASRQSGQQAEEPPLAGVAPLFNTAFKAAVMLNQEQVVAQMQEDAGYLLEHSPA